jgi:putative ABC transport system permease protein
MLFNTSIRYLLRHPWQIGLCVLGVALGVAVVVAIDLANVSAQRAFTLSTESVTGKATHQIVGGAGGLEEDLYRQVRMATGLREVAPLVEGYVIATGLGGRTAQLLGVDPFAEAPFRSYLAGPGGQQLASEAQNSLNALLVEPGTALLAESTAQQAGLRVGSQLELLVGSERRELRVVGLLRPSDDLSRRALENLIITDIATAQETLGMLGRLSRIDLILPVETQYAASLQAMLPPNATLARPAARSAALEQMTRAFALNLSALSLLALVVGMFLIYNTTTFSVVQRRTLFGTLRCIGATQGQVLRLILAEAALISLAGALLGLLLGVVLGQGLVGLVTRTISDLYFVVTVRDASIDPLVLLKGFLLGIGATLVSAAVPALEAMRTPPRTVLRRSSVEDQVRRVVPLAAGVGVAMLLLGAALLLVPQNAQSPISNLQSLLNGIVPAFVALFLVLIGCALVTPAATVALMAGLRPLLGRVGGLLGRMAARDVVAALSRTSVAVAALMVAVSVTIGVGIMVGSFRGTVIAWLDSSLVADVYGAPPSTMANRNDAPLDPALIAELGRNPAVVDTTIFRSISVDTPAGPTSLVAIAATSNRGRDAVQFAAGGDAASWQAFDTGAIFISEPLAYRTGLGVGDTLRLRTDQGERDFPVAAIYYDYASDRGVIRMADSTFRALWNDRAASSFAFYVAPGTNVDMLIDSFEQQIAGRATLILSSNQGLRQGTLEIFDRTFAITGVLQILATIVAFIGILSALMALQLERSRELGMLRANGLTPAQLWRLVLTQTGLMGTVAGLLAIPVGIVLALVLVYVINRRSFGWTLNMTIDPAILAQALLVALIAALLAGVYPAYKMSRTSPAAALREE